MYIIRRNKNHPEALLEESRDANAFTKWKYLLAQIPGVHADNELFDVDAYWCDIHYKGEVFYLHWHAMMEEVVLLPSAETKTFEEYEQMLREICDKSPAAGSRPPQS